MAGDSVRATTGAAGSRSVNCAPAPVGVLEHEVAVHPLGELMPDREAETESGLAARVATAVKTPEDLLALLKRHPRALI